MISPWTIKFVNEAAEAEILDLSADLKAKLWHVSELLLTFGPQNVGLPHIRPLENKLWELRLKGKDNIARSIYILASGRRIVILHTFIKKTQKTPTKNLKIAHSRLKEVCDD
jgi:phage-related protein